jgi:nucleoside-diphosphate-sugar epimerase
MRILVTGTSGYVGSAIASFLLERGWDVVGLSRNPGRMKGPTEYVRADLGVVSFAEGVFSKISPCDAIVHAAACIDQGLYNSSITLTNCLGTQQVLALANIWHSSNLVYISSVPVIGTPKFLPITEDHPTDPRTAYHASKLFGENLVKIAEHNGLIGSNLRLTSPIGPGMPRNRILPVFVKRAMMGEPLSLAGRGTRTQNYVDVRDISAAVENCLITNNAGVFNIAGKRSISNRELADMCVRTLGSASEIVYTGQPDPEEGIIWEVSISKAKECFGYDPHYSIEESIEAVGAEYASGIN